MRLVRTAARELVGLEGLGGCSNTPLGDKFGTPRVRAVEHGVDTWTLLRELREGEELDRACVRFRDVAGRFLRLESGHRAELMPGYRMLRVEGHPAVEGLAHPATLVRARDSVLGELASEGVPVGVEAGLSRIDTTTTLQFEKPVEGLAFLEGLAHLDVNRMGKRVVYRAKGERPLLGAVRRWQGHMTRALRLGLRSRVGWSGWKARIGSRSGRGSRWRRSKSIRSSQGRCTRVGSLRCR